jgi:hypothetical protein
MKTYMCCCTQVSVSCSAHIQLITSIHKLLEHKYTLCHLQSMCQSGNLVLLTVYFTCILTTVLQSRIQVNHILQDLRCSQSYCCKFKSINSVTTGRPEPSNHTLCGADLYRHEHAIIFMICIHFLTYCYSMSIPVLQLVTKNSEYVS